MQLKMWNIDLECKKYSQGSLLGKMKILVYVYKNSRFFVTDIPNGLDNAFLDSI